jgi:glucose/mannose-6-phosphate isomerase
LLRPDIVSKNDPTGLHLVYDNWPKIALKSYQLEKEKINFDTIDHIVLLGMGGSGTISDILVSIMSKSNIHISAVKGYHLPSTVDKNTLVIATSVSGETDETLTVFRDALQHNCKKIAFSKKQTGLDFFCKKNKIPHYTPDVYHSPRASLMSFLYYVLDTLGGILNINQHEIVESISSLESLQKNINSSNLSNSNKALDLAEWISGTPIIYYPWGLSSAAIRFKNSLNENAKMHVIAEDVIEASHNGIVAWEKPSTFQPILIQGQDDYIKTKERWEILKEFFKSKNIEYKEIHSVNGNILTKIVNLIYLLDYATIYKAFLSNIDPAPVDAISFFKNKLNK